jgi:hypothetical protein
MKNKFLNKIIAFKKNYRLLLVLKSNLKTTFNEKLFSIVSQKIFFNKKI